jgi:hypothetical protein
MISANEAVDLVEDRACLVDGTITPCWSYPGHQELWSRKRGTTGFNAQVVCLLDGEPCASTTLFLGAPMMLKRSLLHRFLGSGHDARNKPHNFGRPTFLFQGSSNASLTRQGGRDVTDESVGAG